MAHLLVQVPFGFIHKGPVLGLLLMACFDP